MPSNKRTNVVDESSDDEEPRKKARVDPGPDDAAEVECCSSCGTPWSVSDQEEWSRDDFYVKFRNGDAATVQRVREYWKENVQDWIDGVEDDEWLCEYHDAIPKSLREVVEIMMQDFAFYCEDCNDGVNGSRCYRNRKRAPRSS